MLAGFAVIVGQKAIAAKGGGKEGIPLRSGQFSDTGQGSIAVCLNPSSFAEESCSTEGVLVFPLSFPINGALTMDNTGNNCRTFTEVDSALPLNASPPSVEANEHSVGKVLNYDSTTGTGDSSFTAYIGGKCIGATFNSTGTTEAASGTFHFVVTDAGNRIDLLPTTITDPAGGLGDFSYSETYLRQTKSAS